MKRLLWGNPFGAVPYLGGAQILPGVAELLAPLNPVFFFYGDLASHRMYYRTLASDTPPAISPSTALAWLAVCVALCAFGCACFSRRQAEQAGFPGKKRLVACACAFVPALLCCSMTFDLAAGIHLAFGEALMAAVFIVCVVVFKLAFNGLKAHTMSGLKALALPPLVGAAILVALEAGAISGYGLYAFLPKAADTSSVRVSYVGDPNIFGASALGSSARSSYYITAGYTFDEPEDIALALRLHEMVDSGGRRALMKGIGDFGATVVPYDVRFDYMNNNGNTRIWYYDRASLAELSALLELGQTAAARLGMQAALGGDSLAQGTVYARDAYLRGDVYLSDMTFRDIFAMTLSTESRLELMARVREDSAERELADVYFPADEPLAVLMFTFNGDSDAETFAYHLNNAFIYLDQQGYPRTIDFLRANNLWFDETRTDLAASTDLDQVDMLVLQDYDPYMGMNKPSSPQSLFFMSYLSRSNDDFRVMKDFGGANAVRDPERIAAILPCLRSVYFLSERGALVAVKYKGGDKWVYKFAPGVSY
jgi:ABC-2 type transport system permease protein